jgi:hypothetical protein
MRPVRSASVKPQTELEALLAFQIVATGFAGLKFLQRGQSHLEEVYIGLVSDRLAGAPRAAASTSRNVDSVAGLAGSTSTAIRVAAGTSWRRSSNRLAANSPARKLIPVMLPPAGEAGDQAHSDRVLAGEENDRDSCLRGLDCERRGVSGRNHHRDAAANQIGYQRGQPIALIVAPAIFDTDVLALDEAGVRPSRNARTRSALP